MLRVSCRRCERTVEIQTMDAVRLFGGNAIWKDVAQRLLDNTCQQRTGRYEEAAASYEARKFGVRSAMPSVTAKRQCPDLIFVKPRFEVYKAVSQQIREIFAEHTPIIEPLIAGRGISGRPGKSARHSARARRRSGDSRQDQTGDRPQHFRRHLLQQVFGEARVRPPQAKRPVRHHAGDGGGVRRKPAGWQVSRHRAGDLREDEFSWMWISTEA
jgi:hypothetical protein